VFTTGFSTGFHSQDEQARFIGRSFESLAAFRASKGADSPFAGFMLRDVFSRTYQGNEQTLDTSNWDWRAKASEVIDTWNGSGVSNDMAWWLQRVEGNFGLFALQLDSADNTVLVPSAGLQVLQQISGAVGESSASTPPEPNAPGPKGQSAPGFGKSLELGLLSKGQQELMTLLDLVLQKLNNKMGAWSAAGGQGHPSDPQNQPSAGAPSITMAASDYGLYPSKPRVGETATFTITLRNKGKTDAGGLVLAIVDSTPAADNSLLLLSAETQVNDIVVPGSGSRDVTVYWTPQEARSYDASVLLLDSSMTQYASLPTGAIQVENAASSGSGSTAVANMDKMVLPLGMLQVRSLDVQTMSSTASTLPAFSVFASISNPSSLRMSNVTATLMVDGKIAATKMIGTMEPYQDRAILFPALSLARPGRQEFKLVLEGQGKKLLKGSYSRMIQLQSVPKATQPQSAVLLRPLIQGTPTPFRPADFSTGKTAETRVPVPQQIRLKTAIVSNQNVNFGSQTSVTPAVKSTNSGESRVRSFQLPGSQQNSTSSQDGPAQKGEIANKSGGAQDVKKSGTFDRIKKILIVGGEPATPSSNDAEKEAGSPAAKGTVLPKGDTKEAKRVVNPQLTQKEETKETPTANSVRIQKFNTQSLATLVTPNISGNWRSNDGTVYNLTQNGAQFTWIAAAVNEKGSGQLAGTQISGSWSGKRGTGSSKGKVITDASGNAVRIEWENNVVFLR
jgi:hypothetical protein